MFRNPATDGLVVLFIVLIIFGPKRLPTLGKELGRGIREFKDSISTSSKDAEEAERSQLTAATASTDAPLSAPAVPVVNRPANGERTDGAATARTPAETEPRP